LQFGLEYATYILYNMTGHELAKVLLDRGWVLDRIKGSHHIYVKDGQRSIPVPIKGNRDLPKGLVQAILKQASP
jgi:predicted RNA binding protein YcfA (HicA-like mRNA interferase family)